MKTLLRNLEWSTLGDDTNNSGWQKLTRLFYDEVKSGPVREGPESERDDWVHFSYYYHIAMRKFDRKLFLIFVLALFGITVVILELTHLELFRFAIGLTQNGGLDLFESEPTYCTTWPVIGSDLRYTPIQHEENEAPPLKNIAPKGGWKKPMDIKVIGLIFYGRRRNVDILDCYLLQNLAINGGYLDGVQFMVHTKREEDLAYLTQLVSQRQHYHVVEADTCQGGDYSCMWDTSTEENTIYVKIDDDIVCCRSFFEEMRFSFVVTNSLHRCLSIPIRSRSLYIPGSLSLIHLRSRPI